MKQKRYPYVQSYRDNRGKMRHYFRRKGVRTALPGTPGSDEFDTAYATALAGETTQRSLGPKPKKGTLQPSLRNITARLTFAA